MSNGTILVTGGAGFIGSHLVQSLLSDGYCVRVLDDLSSGKKSNLDRSVELIVGDVGDRTTVEEAMQSTVGCFHLAARASVTESIEAWPDTHRVNLTGCINVFDVATKASDGDPIPVVYASSAAVYGAPETVPLYEDSPTRPLSPYGADKLACEFHAAAGSAVFGGRLVGLRFFNVFGPRQDPTSPYSGVISIFASRISRGQSLTIFGDGSQTRDFIYVGDVVRFLRAAMVDQTPGAVVYNVGTGKETSVLQLAKVIADLEGQEPEILFGEPRIGDIARSLANCDRAKMDMAIEAEVTLEEGLRETLQWMRTQ